MVKYEELGDSTLKKLDLLTDNEILFVINHCSHNLIKKTLDSDIIDYEKKTIIQTVAEMVIYFVQLTNMYNVSADELEYKIGSFNKSHETDMDIYFKKILDSSINENKT